MKNTTILYQLLGLLFSLNGYAQLPLPGGVQGSILWCRAEKINEQTGFNIQTPNAQFFQKSEQTTASEKQISSLNYNPALQFNGHQTTIKIPLPNLDLSKMSVFTVLCPADTFSEKSIWFIEKNAKSTLFLTDKRIADLEDIRFMNLNLETKNALAPQIITFDQFKKTDTLPLIGQFLIIGKSPVLPVTPTLPFAGQLAELIIFDRVISAEERQKVESYLSLKYGISLAPLPFATYWDASGQIVRNGKKYSNFGWHIAGLGRDDAGGFYQKQSENTSETPILTLSAGKLASTNMDNKSIIEDKSYLVWGDDNGTLKVLIEKKPGQPRFLHRTWKMTNSGNVEKVKTNLHFNARLTDADLQSGEVWYMTIDRSGKDKFSVGETEFIPVNQFTASELAVFENIQWPGTETAFTFALAPTMFAHFEIENPNCITTETGKIKLSVVGGKPPYSCFIKNLESGFSKTLPSYDHNYLTINDLNTGNYSLEIKDTNGKTYKEDFFIGCISQEEIKVTDKSEPIFRKIEVNPNPSPDGKFRIEVALNEVANAEIEVFDLTGRLVKKYALRGSDFYIQNLFIDVVSGIFLVKVTSGNDSNVSRLVVL
jgi:hypothetical protein